MRTLLFLVILLNGAATLAVDKSAPPVTNNLAADGLTVTNASSHQFEALLSQFLDPDQIAKGANFLSQALIITNNTGKFIWSFTIVYEYPDKLSASGTPWRYIVSPTASSPANRKIMLGPGASYLVTPVSDFLASRNADGRRTLQPHLDEGLDRMIALYESQFGSERVTVSVDSVIYEDGTLSGLDSVGRMTQLNSRIEAEKDLAVETKGLNGDALRKTLSYVSGLGPGDEYRRQKVTRAQHLLAILESQGEAAVQQELDQMRSAKWFVESQRIRRQKQ
jgi:hypothetical protein